ncbi:MAG: N-acyl homoserine lactonase family protein [Pseudomonadota bacterium]
MRTMLYASAAALVLSACGGGDPEPADSQTPITVVNESEPTGGVDTVELHKLDCGTIEISNLDDFSSAGDYAGVTDTYANTCWLVRHPDGDMIWGTGVPGMLAGQPAFEQDIYTVSLETTLTQQLRDRGISTNDIDYVSISHSHFDHVGQIDQVSDATWIVHEDEYAYMFPAGEEGDETATQFGAFVGMTYEIFSGEKDVFGDGSVIIFPTPGHTPGHTALEVNLTETGPILLTGDLYHRTESRELRRVPRFNTSEEQTLASMDAFEARADRLGAKVIIQHELDDIAPLPDVLR